MAALTPRKGGFSEVMSLWDVMDRWFDMVRTPELIGERSVVPAFDVSETDDHIIVKADLPGVEPKDLEISIVGSVLTVRGEKKQEKEEKGESFHRIERSYGSFSRSISLPGDVDPDTVDAVYKDGVLKLTIPKTERSKRKKIEVKTK